MSAARCGTMGTMAGQVRATRWRDASLAAIAAVLAAACSSPSSGTVQGTDSGTVVPTSGPGTTESVPIVSDTTEPVPSGGDDLVASGATLLTVDGGVDWLQVAGGGLWGAGATLVKLDGATGEQVASVAVGGVCLAMDSAAGSLWVGDCDHGAVVRVDPADGSVLATVTVPGGLQEESSIGAGPEGVFVVSTDGTTITRIDPLTNAVAGTFAAPEGATAVRVGFGSLWVTSYGADTLSRLDPTTGAVQAQIDTDFGPRFLAVGPDAVWVLGQTSGNVTRVDPATNTAVASIEVDAGRVRGGDIAVGGGYVWARVSSTLVARIDPQTNEVVASYGPPAGSGSVAAGDGAAWISAHDIDAVWRFPLLG